MVNSQFKFKGASIKVDVIGSTIDWGNALKLSTDASTIARIQRSHGRSANSPLRDTLMLMRQDSRNFRVRVITTMTNKAGSRKIEEWKSDLIDYVPSGHIRQVIRSHRKRLISRLRDDKERYSRLQVSTIRPSHISYRYAGSINSMLQVYGNSRVGYVHSEPNQIVRILEHRLSSRMFEPVRPMTSERHVGIEIECGIAVSRERLGYLLRQFKGFVMVKGDGSVSVAGREAVELNICAPISQYKQILHGVCAILNGDEVKAKVNKTCGLHVHLDIREWRNDFNALQDKYARLISVQGILYNMQPKSRQDNTYCVKSKSRSINRGASRYQGINAQAIWKYSTIETRVHAGTTDYAKITNWVDLLAGVMYSTAVTPKRALSKVASVFKYYSNLPISLMEYIVSRTRQFSDGSEEAETAQAA